MTSLSYTTITGTFDDGSGTPLSGQVVFTPSETVYSAGVPVASASNPVTIQVISGSLQTVHLLATDNTGLYFAGLTGFFYWTAQVTLGGITQTPWSFFLPSSPTTVDLYALANTPAGGGGVTGVTAGDASIVIGGTADAPTVETGTLDEIADLHPPAANVPMNGKKFTSLGNGSASGDSVAYGQLASAAFEPSSAFLATPAWLFDITNAAYGAAGDGQIVIDGAITGSASTLTTVGLTAPSAPTLAHSGSGGSVLAGTYQAEITYVNAHGETVASSSTSVTTTGSGSTITVDSPALSGDATEYNVYLTQAGGSTYTLQATVVIGQNFILTAPPTSGGANPPGSNTTASNPFTAGDVGKAVIVNGSGGTSVAQVGTITGYTSPGSVTVSFTATTTVSGAAVFWGSDDTTPIQDCLNAAVTYMEAHGYARMRIPQAPGGLFFMVAGPIVNTGMANAQIVIPNPAISTQQGTLEITADTPTPLSMWTGQVPQAWGAIVSTGIFANTSAQVSNNTTYETPAAVIGSTPATAALLTQVDSLPAFANINVTCTNLTIVTPQSDQASNFSGINLKGCAKGTFRNCTALITANYLTASGPNEFPVISHLINGLSTGFVLPGNGNNAVANAYDCTISGYTFGAVLAEQGVLQDALVVGCGWGYQLSGADPTPGEHLIRVRASIQKCYNVVWVQGTGSPSFSVDGDLDLESLSNNANTFIQDSNNGAGLASLGGELRVYGNFNLQIFPPKRPLYVKIVNKQLAGNVPGLVAGYAGFTTAGSAVAVQNPYWRDVWADYAGGSVISVLRGATYGGNAGTASLGPAMTATGLPASGEVLWPSGGWLAFGWTGTFSPSVNLTIPA